MYLYVYMCVCECVHVCSDTLSTCSSHVRYAIDTVKIVSADRMLTLNVAHQQLKPEDKAHANRYRGD